MREVLVLVIALLCAGFCYIFHRVVAEHRIDGKLNIPDVVCMIAVVVIAFCIGMAGYYTAVPLILALGIALWASIQVCSIRLSMRDGVPVNAHVVDYHVKTKVIHRKYQPTEKYPVYAPIVEYETPSGTIRAAYPVFSKDQWYQEQAEWKVCYDPMHPEFFWFPERQREMISGYWELIGLSVLIVVGSVVFPRRG